MLTALELACGMPRKVNTDGDSESDLEVAIFYTLLVLTLTFMPFVLLAYYFSK